MQRLLVAGNWKMHGSKAMTVELLSDLQQQLSKNSPVEALVCPASPYLQTAAELLTGSKIKLGAQNVSQFEQGAYTGEVSLTMLEDLACDYVILGHSERREIFEENDQTIAAKFKACLKTSITPILCVGETIEQRNSGQTNEVIAEQIDAILSEVGIAGFSNAVVAYEPVWAIGTGETASPKQAQDAHRFIRQRFAKLDESIAQQMQILYGGSVNPSNAEELFSQADINGGLIGGASLKADDFAAICLAAEKVAQH